MSVLSCAPSGNVPVSCPSGQCTPWSSCCRGFGRWHQLVVVKVFGPSTWPMFASGYGVAWNKCEWSFPIGHNASTYPRRILPNYTKLQIRLIDWRCPAHEEWVSVYMCPQQKAAALLTRTHHFNHSHGGLWRYIIYTRGKYLTHKTVQISTEYLELSRWLQA